MMFSFTAVDIYETSCAICYHWQNFKNVNNTHRGVLLLRHSSMGAFHLF